MSQIKQNFLFLPEHTWLLDKFDTLVMCVCRPSNVIRLSRENEVKILYISDISVFCFVCFVNLFACLFFLFNFRVCTFGQNKNKVCDKNAIAFLWAVSLKSCFKTGWDDTELLLRYSWIFLRYCRHISEILHSFCQDMKRSTMLLPRYLLLKYCTDIFKMLLIYFWDMQNIVESLLLLLSRYCSDIVMRLPRYIKDIAEILPKYCSCTGNIFIYYWYMQKYCWDITYVIAKIF